VAGLTAGILAQTYSLVAAAPAVGWCAVPLLMAGLAGWVRLAVQMRSSLEGECLRLCGMLDGGSSAVRLNPGPWAAAGAAGGGGNGRPLREFQPVRDGLCRTFTLHRQQRAVEDLLFPLARFDREGNPTSVNQAFASLFGYRSDQFLRLRWDDLIHPDYQREAQTMRTLAQGGREQKYYLETRGLRRDGSAFAVALTLVRAADPACEELGVYCVAEDISVRQTADAMFRKVVESSPNGMLMTGEDGNILMANAAAERMFGHRRQELIGRPVEILLPERLRAAYLLKRAEHLLESTTRRMGGDDLIGLRRNGEEFPLEVLLTPIHSDAGTVVISTITDATEQNRRRAMLKRAKEAAEEADRAKSDFLARMSHEIRTPLNAISGASDLLSNTRLDDRQREYVGVFRRNAIHLLRLVDGILDLSRLQAGKLVLSREPYSLVEVVEGSIQTMAASAERRGLSISLALGPDVPHYVYCDPGRLQQILLNLIGNAIKFTERGEIGVRVEKEPSAEEPDRIRISVSDTGCGIPQAQLEAIFSAFHQGDPSICRSHGGSGLGLSIVRNLVELMGGRVWVDSQVGRGSTFSVAISLAPCERAQDVIVDAASTSPTQLLAHRILVVEDSEDNLFLVRAYLEEQPVELETAGNGALAVERVRQTQFDLVLMDIQMPIMDGYTATRAIRRLEKELGRKPVPIVALTAHALAGEVRLSLAAGCTAHLTKPILKTELLSAIATYALPPADCSPAACTLDPAVRAVVPQYVCNRVRDLRVLGEALAASDYSKVQHLAHNLKGTGKAYGFPEITTIGWHLEEAAKSRNAREVRVQMEALRALLSRIPEAAGCWTPQGASPVALIEPARAASAAMPDDASPAPREAAVEQPQ
jgi:PAS domain S-box-containing protein